MKKHVPRNNAKHRRQMKFVRKVAAYQNCSWSGHTGTERVKFREARSARLVRNATNNQRIADCKAK